MKSEKENGGPDRNSGEAYLENLLKKGCEEYVSDDEIELPEWYDKELTIRGQTYLNKFRLIIFNGMLTGLIAVLSIPSIVKILIATKQSSTATMAFRRYSRTMFHAISWFQYPLVPGSKSWKSIEMVRKAHYKSSIVSDKQNCGKISQKDLALTQFSFMGFYSLQTDSIGLADEEFKISTIHLWRTIGHLLGIKDEYNLCTDSWDTTKQRLDIILKKVYRPALENSSEEFIQMTKALIDGIWPTYNLIDWGTGIYYTKYLAKCCNFEYFETDDFGGTEKFKEYYKLPCMNRFIVFYGMFLIENLYKYTIVRKFINFRLWIYEIWARYFPYLAIYKYGFKWAYVSIFDKKGESLHYD